jgi:aspartate/tyrosine/aromatic aminotransferase
MSPQVAITQSISGTGALRIGGAFLQRFYPKGKTIYLPTPSWGNHTPIFKDSGLEVKQVRGDYSPYLAPADVSQSTATTTRRPSASTLRA